jgi:hypothetical protein
MEIEDDPKIF